MPLRGFEGTYGSQWSAAPHDVCFRDCVAVCDALHDIRLVFNESFATTGPLQSVNMGLQSLPHDDGERSNCQW
jgi:hypothetical protein